MIQSKLALLLLSSISIAVCVDEKSAYRAHKKFLKMFPCKDPQPRVLQLEDVVPENVLKDKYEGVREMIRPTVTLLHRCNATGCCENFSDRCMPSSTTEVTLTFAIFHPSIHEFFKVKATNHTACACEVDEKYIK
ncbi:hypothetical protein NQ315_004277 [Exocentrus adspersus]|uniref:Platelet-derived growth factor (PDGF) family profile domain-containing protein n=1 Tax=Exocentrus adspersus TaxID=1586481 RepID=A0AAV8W7G8_9CUCU|nr:hypothetical protein NQ315_004277 [Exocentrus adspersus]